MSKRKERIDVRGGGAEALTDNPFAALAASLPKDLPKQKHTPDPSPPCAEILPPKGLDYRVERTRKGGYDITFERRAKGNGVTVLRRVHGDGDSLLRKLKKRCGAGGAWHDDSIELQGDHRKALEDYLHGEGL